MNRFVLAGVFVTLSSLTIEARTATDDGWIELSHDLQAWQEAVGEWYQAGDARIDPKNSRRISGKPGHGVLVNGKDGRTQNLVTRQQWGDVEIQLEFLIPQGSNSGVKLESVYEIQIADSAKVAKPTGADCGGIYPRAEAKPKYHHIDDGIAPLTNAAKPAGEWQTLEIVFRAPRFDFHNKKVANAQFEQVRLNGKLIHDHVDVAYPTGNVWREKEKPRGPLLLQADHGPVAFRNIRVRPLAAPTALPAAKPISCGRFLPAAASGSPISVIFPRRKINVIPVEAARLARILS
jgi:hypothetical protein